MRDRLSSSPINLFIPSTKMASTTTSTNVNEILPGLESFLRSMVNSSHLDTDHRQIATMYIDKLDRLTKPDDQHSPNSPQGYPITPLIDDQSLINTDIVSVDDDDDSDDFTDEEEEQRKLDLKEQREREEQQQRLAMTPTVPRRVSTSENQLYQSARRKSSAASSQWYVDVPKNGYLEPSSPQLSQGRQESLSSKTASRLSISGPSSSTIIADGLLLTYDENHEWIWRYYVLDDFDLICFPADKKSHSNGQTFSDNEGSPLWVSDMTNAKVQTTVVDKTECLCLQIGVAEAIYVRPSDPNQINFWLKAFREASSAKKSKENSKSRNNVKTLSRNARRMFAQFNRKKGQIVSHLLDQMANVTGVDEKTRKHCELRGFLVISLDNQNFVTKYCTIVDGIFRVHKSRLSEQTDHELCLNRCTLSFPEERTRDIQFALIDEQVGTIFIRGNNIYSMGRLLNSLAKYVEITGSSQFAFPSIETSSSTTSNRNESLNLSSQTHFYSDVDVPPLINEKKLKNDEIYSPSSSSHSSSNLKTSIYHNASKLYDDNGDASRERTFVLPGRKISQGETYDRPKSYDNVAVISTPVDKNNNHVVPSPPRPQRSKSKSSFSQRSNDPPSIPSSPENTVFCLRASDSSSSSSRRRPNPLPRRSSTQTTPSDYVNKLAHLFTKGFSTNSPSSSPKRENPIDSQTYDVVSTSTTNLPSMISSRPLASNPKSSFRTFEQEKVVKRVYDIPITIERSTNSEKNIRSSRSFEPLSSVLTKPLNNRDDDDDDDDEETPYSQGYDNLTKNDGIGKFRFVVPFNHSPTSAFTASTPSKKLINSPTSSSSSTISSFSTANRSNLMSLSKTNSTLNTKSSTNRSTLMTAV